MVCFNKGWEPSDMQITQEQAKKLVLSMLQPKMFQLPSPPALSVQASHIGQYIEHMMNDLDYTLLDLTITKDADGDIVFEVIHKEK